MSQVANCGCSFDAHHSIPPQYPCDHALLLLDDLLMERPTSEEGYDRVWLAYGYAEHMKEALGTIRKENDL